MIYDLFKYLTENKIECAGNFDLTSAILHHGLVNQKIPVLCVRSHDFAIVSVKFSSFEIILSQKVAKLTCEVLYCDNSPEFIGSFLSMFIPDYSAEHLSQFKSDLKDLFDKKTPLLFHHRCNSPYRKVIEILKLEPLRHTARQKNSMRIQTILFKSFCLFFPIGHYPL